jgi:hypothetical protein
MAPHCGADFIPDERTVACVVSFAVLSLLLPP